MADWRNAAGIDELKEGKPARAGLDGESVLLLKVDDRVLAVSNQCTHQGAGLDRGVVRVSGPVRTVTCPAHGSMFDLESGKVMRPPATNPVPVYDVKIENGRVYVRPRADG